jgi:acylphosphatase
VHIRVYGIVQGVYFRANTQRVARTLEITGWVRNLPDGSVEIRAQGKEENLAKLIKWCKKGPPGATVKEVKVKENPCTKPLEGFKIKYY